MLTHICKDGEGYGETDYLPLPFARGNHRQACTYDSWSRCYSTDTRQALIYSESRKSKKTEHIHSIFVSTHGLLFFGTPHHGSSKANLASSLQRMVNVLLPSRVVDTDSQLLNSLKEESEILQEVTDNFQSKMKRFYVFYFWEMEKSDLGVTWDYVSICQSS